MTPVTQSGATEWARSVILQPDVLILDTETTGTGRSDEVVDIGIVDIEGNVLLDTLVRPIRPIPEAATNVHGISNEDVENAPLWPEVYIELYYLFRNYRSVVIYNLDFDLRLMNQSSRKYELMNFSFHEKRDYSWYCAMKQYSEYNGEWNQRYGNYRWHKLEKAIESFGIPVPNDQHRALADAQSTLKLVYAMAGRI